MSDRLISSQSPASSEDCFAIEFPVSLLAQDLAVQALRHRLNVRLRATGGDGTTTVGKMGEPSAIESAKDHPPAIDRVGRTV